MRAASRRARGSTGNGSIWPSSMARRSKSRSSPRPWCSTRSVHAPWPSTARAVDEDDALEVAAGAGIQERLEAFAQLIPGAYGACGAGKLLGDEPVGEVGGDGLHDGAEQAGLVAEVVVQRASGDAGAGHDLLGPGARITLLREQLAGGLPQACPPRCRDGLRTRLAGHTMATNVY
jgi:hypothetical protein